MPGAAAGVMFECALYARAGVGHAEAWRLMSRSCEVPPSLEVFDHVLAELRAKSGLQVSPQWLGSKIASSYQRQL
jgi:hypothetical protein